MQPEKRLVLPSVLVFQENLDSYVNLLIFKVLAIKSTFKRHVSENTHSNQYTYTCVHSSTAHNSQMWNQHSCPSMEERIHKTGVSMQWDVTLPSKGRKF